MTKILIDNPGGNDFYSCECVQAVWPLFAAEAKRRGYVKQCVDALQGSYNTTVRASAKTHFGGGVIDFGPARDDLDALAEEFGFVSYLRSPAQGFTYHIHVVLRGCPHLHPQAADQVTDWLNMRDGLAYHRPDPDRSRPSTIRNWRQAVDWAGQQTRARATNAVIQVRPAISFSVTMAGITGAGKGKFSGNVRILQQLLNRSQNSKATVGRSIPEDGIWGPLTQKVFQSYQQRLGFRGRAADGIPGMSSFTCLVQWRMNYRAVA